MLVQKQFCWEKACGLRLDAPAETGGASGPTQLVRLSYDRARQVEILPRAAQASRSILSSPKAVVLGLHNLAEPHVLCNKGRGVLQSSMNVRLVEFDLVPLLSEVKPASNDATEKSGQKYQDGIQHFVRPQMHSQPAPARGEGLSQCHQYVPR